MNDELQREHQRRRDEDDGDLVAGERERADLEIFDGEDLGERARRRAEEDLAGILQQQRHADGGDEDVERGRAAQRPIGELLNRHAEQRAADHRGQQHGEAAPHRVLRHEFAGIVADERPDHEHVRVREIDEAQDTVDHRVAERDERVDGAEGEAVDQLLEEFGQVKVRVES